MNVELRGCQQTKRFISVKDAEEEDWGTEYLSPILSIKLVMDVSGKCFANISIDLPVNPESDKFKVLMLPYLRNTTNNVNNVVESIIVPLHFNIV